MTGPVALKAAYVVTWLVLLGYLSFLFGRFRRVREEMKDLKRSSRSAGSEAFSSGSGLEESRPGSR